MSNLVIPAAPPPATAGTGNGAAPAAGDHRFGDTLRQTQGRPETQPGGRVAAHDAAPEHAGDKPDADRQGRSKDDDRAGKQADAKHPDSAVNVAQPLPPAAPLPPPLAATVRQPPAADGKPLPATTTPAAALKGVALAAVVSGVPPQTAAPAANPHATAASGIPAAATSEAASDSSLAAAQTSSSKADAPADGGSGKKANSPRPAPNDFTAQLAQLVAAHTAPAAASHAAPPVQLAMQATPQQMPQFAQETAQHIAWLAGQGIQKAEIRLNPGKLGPIHVEISTHHDRVDVSFAVQHPQTVHALQQTLPQLHDMLAQQGLNLGQASVGQQAPGQQHAAFAQQPGVGGSHDGRNAGSAESDPQPAWRTTRIATPGRVDDFA